VKKLVAIIIGGTGQFGITLSKKLLKKKYKVIITTRSEKKKINFSKKFLKTKFECLNIYNISKIKKILKEYNPSIIFYFAGQSSPSLSFIKKKETYKSNFVGCKNILNVLYKIKSNSKFLNMSSSEMYGIIDGKIKLSSPKKPLNPYGKAKLLSFNLVKKYREQHNLAAYNAISFNTDSYLRKKNYLIPKICLAAINAYKFNAKTTFYNTLVAREWNWCEEQCDFLIQFIKKKPQDFILSNGKIYLASEMLEFAFSYFKLDYLKFIHTKRKYLKKNEIKIKASNYSYCLKRNNIKAKHKIYGKEIIRLMIKYYLDEKKY
jgi:GDPmannose 4,6-dehydratase